MVNIAMLYKIPLMTHLFFLDPISTISVRTPHIVVDTIVITYSFVTCSRDSLSDIKVWKNDAVDISSLSIMSEYPVRKPDWKSLNSFVVIVIPSEDLILM
jgi:hypothetical protein